MKPPLAVTAHVPPLRQGLVEQALVVGPEDQF